MYSGHFGVALAGAGRARNIPLLLLIVAALASDLVEAIIGSFGVHDVTRVWSHSAPAAAAAGAVLALGWRAAGGTWRESAIVLLTSVSHTLLDFVTASKSVWPGVRPMSLHLYTRPYLDLVVEVTICAAGWMVWRASLPAEKRGGIAAWAALGTLLVVQGLACVHLVIYGTTGNPDAVSKFVR